MILQEIYNKNEKNIRLDLFLIKYIKDISRNKIQKLINNGFVKVDDYIVKPSFKLKGNENIIIEEEITEKPHDIIKENIPIDILYEDDDLVVINKPAGLVVHPGAGNYSGTLLNGLLYHFDKLSLKDSIRPGIVHRLDKYTSGVILVAKTDKTHYNLSEQFANRKIKKIYRAIVWGDISDSGEIESFIKRDRTNRVKFMIDKSNGRSAFTKFKKLNYARPFSYVELYPRTGRTHQLRVHLNSINHPIILDELYAGGEKRSASFHPDCKAVIRSIFKKINRFALHAHSIEFEHPTTKKKNEFEAPIPSDFQSIIHEFKW